MDEAWELHYSPYDAEAEWYGTDDPRIWICDIPSQNITVKMVLSEDAKRVSIYETTLQKQSDYSHIRDAEWKTKSHYEW